MCLNVGCIPSKALLHVAKVLTEAHELGEAGISFGEPPIDVDQVREWKDGVVGKLTGGLEGLAKQRKVQVVRGRHVHRARTRSRSATPSSASSTASSRRARRRRRCRSCPTTRA